MKRSLQTYYWMRLKIIFLLLAAGLSLSCYEETVTPIEVSFSTAFVNADESVPVQVFITNTTEGAETYLWTFEGAEPSTSTDQNPGAVVYNIPGTYSITLEASNTDGVSNVETQSIAVVDDILIDFSAEIIESNFPPVEVELNNLTDGVDLTYNWTFEGGIPSTSLEKFPPSVRFETPGEHVITLEVSNGFESFSEQTTITVAPDIQAEFDYEVDFFDDDFQAPVSIQINNTSISATDYLWTFEVGLPATSTEENPRVTFTSPGTYSIQLEADNGKQTSRTSAEITVFSDTNLRTFTSIDFGINSAHNSNSKGAFFSTALREVFKANQVTAENGASIDLVFFGLNSNFSFNKFVSPDQAGQNGFSTIPNATQTKIINSQEICDCGASLTPEEFDNMTDDSLLDALTITETNNGSLPFDDTELPRVVLFETEDQRKGAIKITDFIDDGQNSFIRCDIKVQKQ